MQRKTECGDAPTQNNSCSPNLFSPFSHHVSSDDIASTHSSVDWGTNNAPVVTNFVTRNQEEHMGQARRHLEAQLFPDAYSSSSSSRDARNERIRSESQTIGGSETMNLFRSTYPHLRSSSNVGLYRDSQQTQSLPNTIRGNQLLDSVARSQLPVLNSDYFPVSYPRNQLSSTTLYHGGGSGSIPTTMSSLATTATQPLNYTNYHSTFEEETALSVNRENEQLVYTVAFKTCEKEYLIGIHISCVDIVLGSKVIVTAGERGEDFGCVTHIYSVRQYVQDRLNLPHTAQINITRYAAGRILRLANDRECRMFAMKTTQEQEVLQYARHLVDNVHRLENIRLLEAEFQFDRHRLTLHYEAAARVDFRLLVRDLFAAYGVRVWMERIHIQQMPSPVMLAAAAAATAAAGAGGARVTAAPLSTETRASQQSHPLLRVQQHQSQWGPEQHEQARAHNGYSGEHAFSHYSQGAYYPQHQNNSTQH